MEEILGYWMDKLDFGPEWKDALVTLITTGILCPPIYTFHMEMIAAKSDKKSDKKLVKLILSPETSIDELRLAWKLQIQKMKTEGWPDFKKVNLADGLKKNLMEEVEVEKLKNDLSTDFKYPDLSQMETIKIRGKENDPKEVKRIVSDYRRKLKQFENVSVKPLKMRPRKTYTDIAEEIHGLLKNKDKKKKADLLRQHKHRSKM